MTENIMLLRHYIFINPNNVLSDNGDSRILNCIKAMHKKRYRNCEIVKYYGYNDIVDLLNKYDNELCKLYLQLNVNYPALLADIGRLIILYTYGGIYHDLKCISNKNMIDYLKSVSSEIELIAEEHPLEKHRVRNTNIIALHKKSNFIKSVLEKIKKKLATKKNYFGPEQMFDIGSGIYINEFSENTNQCIYKHPFETTNMLEFNFNIYNRNIKKWQDTYEYIFKNSARSSFGV